MLLAHVLVSSVGLGMVPGCKRGARERGGGELGVAQNVGGGVSSRTPHAPGESEKNQRHARRSTQFHPLGGRRWRRALAAAEPGQNPARSPRWDVGIER